MFLFVAPTGAEAVGPAARGAAHISRDGEKLTLSFDVKQLASGEVIGQAQRKSEPADAHHQFAGVVDIDDLEP